MATKCTYHYLCKHKQFSRYYGFCFLSISPIKLWLVFLNLREFLKKHARNELPSQRKENVLLRLGIWNCQDLNHDLVHLSDSHIFLEKLYKRYVKISPKHNTIPANVIPSASEDLFFFHAEIFLLSPHFARRYPLNVKKLVRSSTSFV